ncbi:MAG: hypothetical protein C0501_19180 [Isosphaera sp.]|nr:hypothetical protein [Isosphaera sp.]
MDERDTPTAPPATNGHPAAAAEESAPPGPPAPHDDPDKLPLTPEGWEVLADMRWVDDEFHRSTWDPYVGNYIAVVRKRLLGYGPDYLALREQVAREHNVSPDRLVIRYVDPGIDT